MPRYTGGMAKLNHSRPELKYKDGLSKMRRQFVAMAKDLAKAPAPNRVIKGTTGRLELDDHQMRTIMAMMDGMNDYIETFSRFAQGVMAPKNKKLNARAAKLKDAERVMCGTIRIYIAMCLEDSLKNNGQMSAGLKAFNNKLSAMLNDAPMLADVFKDEMQHMEKHLQKTLHTPPTKQGKLVVS